MMEEWKIQNIFSKCQKRKFWNIFLPKNLANDFYDHRNSAAGTRVHVPHPSLLARLLRTTKTRLKNITQLALLRRIHAIAGPKISFHLCLPLSRLATYKASWKQDRWGSFWTGNWREDDAGPAPGAVATEPLSSLLPSDAQGNEWLPRCCRTGELEMAPIGDVTTEARRIRALVSRDCNRHSRGAAPYWNDNTFKLAARVHCIPESTIGQRGHRLRQVDRRNWSVGSNRIKRLIPDTTAWRAEGHCKLCKVSMDSYDHLYRECPGEDLCRARSLGTVALKEKWQELPPGESTLAQLLLELYEEPDGYRVALGDLTRLQRQRLRAAYMGLERPTDRDADATFLRQMRRLNSLREAIWEERRHMLDPSARSWSEELPKGSKWFVVYRGHACGVFADYDLAKAQIFQVPGGKLRGFSDEAAAGAADQLRLALELQRQQDRVHAEGTALISVYTDGSYSKAEPSLHTPSKAGWAFLAVHSTEDRVLGQRNNFLMLDPDDPHYHGATHKSNNTGEVTAIGEALAWIHQQPPDPAISYEICSDSYYGIDAVDVMPGRDSSRIRNGRLIQWAYS